MRRATSAAHRRHARRRTGVLGHRDLRDVVHVEIGLRRHPPAQQGRVAGLTERFLVRSTINRPAERPWRLKASMRQQHRRRFVGAGCQPGLFRRRPASGWWMDQAAAAHPRCGRLKPQATARPNATLNTNAHMQNTQNSGKRSDLIRVGIRGSLSLIAAGETVILMTPPAYPY